MSTTNPPTGSTLPSTHNHQRQHRHVNLPTTVPQLNPSHQVLGAANRRVHVLTASSAWREIIEPATDRKRFLDRVLNAKAWANGQVSDADRELAATMGFHLEAESPPSGTGIGPATFAELLIGPFRAGEPPGGQPLLVSTPAWAAVGWNRKRHQAPNLRDAQARRALIDQDTIAMPEREGTGQWIKPLPLIICGEGKNRVDLHTEFFKDFLVNLSVDALPEAAALRMRHLAGAPGVVALQLIDAGRVLSVALLPWAELSVPILQAAGVPGPSGWWVATPFCAPIRALSRRRGVEHVRREAWRLALNPGQVRAALLAKSFV